MGEEVGGRAEGRGIEHELRAQAELQARRPNKRWAIGGDDSQLSLPRWFGG